MTGSADDENHKCPTVDLDPELRIFLDEFALRHPLVFGIPYVKAMNGHYNKVLEIKSADVRQASLEKNWVSYLYLHERPYRLNAFLMIMDRMTDPEYWDLLRHIWTDSENIWQNVRVWKRLLKSARPFSERFMDEEERAALAALPEKVTIYRGYQKKLNRNGLSFTLDRAIAVKLGRRWLKTCDVWKRVVKREQIFAYLKSRGEEEIILVP